MLSLCQCLLRPPRRSGERSYAVVLANIPSIFSYTFPFSFLPRYLTSSHSVSVFLSVPPASAPRPADRQTTTYAHTSNMLLFQSHPWKSAPEKAWISHQIRGVFFFFLLLLLSCYLPCPGPCTVLLFFFFFTTTWANIFIPSAAPALTFCFCLLLSLSVPIILVLTPLIALSIQNFFFFLVIIAFTPCSTDVPFPLQESDS